MRRDHRGGCDEMAEAERRPCRSCPRPQARLPVVSDSEFRDRSPPKTIEDLVEALDCDAAIVDRPAIDRRTLAGDACPGAAGRANCWRDETLSKLDPYGVATVEIIRPRLATTPVGMVSGMIGISPLDAPSQRWRDLADSMTDEMLGSDALRRPSGLNDTTPGGRSALRRIRDHCGELLRGKIAVDRRSPANFAPEALLTNPT